MKASWLVAVLVCLVGVSSVASAYSAADLTARVWANDLPDFRILFQTNVNTSEISYFEVRTTFAIDPVNPNLALLLINTETTGYWQDAVFNYTCGSGNAAPFDSINGSVRLKDLGSWTGSGWTWVVLDMERGSAGIGGIASKMATFTGDEQTYFTDDSRMDYGQSCAVTSNYDMLVTGVVFPVIDAQGIGELYSLPNEAMSSLTTRTKGTLFSMFGMINLGFVIFATLLVVFLFVFLWKIFEYILRRVSPKRM